MTDYNVEFDSVGMCDTTSHGGERHGGGAAGYMNWRQIHCIDPTLGSRFKTAMIRLEELLYALYGAPPVYDEYPNDWEWWKREHPRCQWEPEQHVQQQLAAGSSYYSMIWKEIAAMGDYYTPAYTPRCGDPPDVPVKSRSGDPAYQFAAASHHQQFPIGSVTREYSTAPYDPGGRLACRGWAGDTVNIEWTPPAGTQVVSATVYTNRHSSISMTEAAGVYSATIPVYDHGEWVGWYIKAVIGDEISQKTIYEPRVPTSGPFELIPSYVEPPATPAERGQDQAYTYVPFTHSNELYDQGLPEYLHWLSDEDRDCWQKTTDKYEFTGDEKIQPELINLCRFVLNQITCPNTTNDVEGSRVMKLFHSPRERDNEACCVKMPIKWLWSGTNVPGHYIAGGKAAEGAPLHTLDDAGGSAAARRTWRGIPMVFKTDLWYDENLYFGSNESWLQPYWNLEIEPYPDDPSIRDVFDCGDGAGLKHDDVIDVVHLEEIIQAVDYLVRYGCWMPVEQHSCKLTPPESWSWLGKACGDDYEMVEQQGGPNWEEGPWTCCGCRCCDYREPLGGVYQVDTCSCPDAPGYHSDVGTPCLCTPWAKPDADACQNDGVYCGHDKCYISQFKSVQHGWNTSTGWFHHGISEYLKCNAGMEDMGCARCHYECDPPGPDTYGCLWQCDLRGWSAWVCGPGQCLNGCDENHGNGMQKYRVSGDSYNGFTLATYGPSFGNCFGDLYHCSSLLEELAGEVDLWFGVISPQVFLSVAEAWWNAAPACGDVYGESTCTQPVDADWYPPIPGFGEWHWDHASRLCIESCIGGGLLGGTCPNRVDCNCSLLEIDDSKVCEGEEVWAAVDLNLDGNDMPYITYTGGGNDGSYGYQPQGGEITDGIPKLRDYNPQPCLGFPTPWDENCPYWWTGPYGGYQNCPCDTYTGPVCGG